MPGYFSLSVYLMRGEHDDRLAWPFRGDITVQLVNQINDQNHMKVTLKFSKQSELTDTQTDYRMPSAHAHRGITSAFMEYWGRA